MHDDLADLVQDPDARSALRSRLLAHVDAFTDTFAQAPPAATLDYPVEARDRCVRLVFDVPQSGGVIDRAAFLRAATDALDELFVAHGGTPWSPAEEKALKKKGPS